MPNKAKNKGEREESVISSTHPPPSPSFLGVSITERSSTGDKEKKRRERGMTSQVII